MTGDARRTTWCHYRRYTQPLHARAPLAALKMARLRALRRVLVDALTAHDEQQRSALACAHFASYAPAGGDVNAMLLRARGPAHGRCCRRISPLPSPTLTAAEQNKERRERETACARVHTCAFSRLDVLRSTAFWAGDARQRRRERPRPCARADSRQWSRRRARAVARARRRAHGPHR